MEGKPSTQRERFFNAYLPINSGRCWKYPMFGGPELRNSLPPNYSKYAVECD